MNDEQDERMPILKDSIQIVDWEQFKKKYYTQENQIQLILKQLNEWHSDISKKLVQIDKSEPICDEDDLENNRKFSSINMSAFSDLLEEINDQMQNMTGMLETMTISPEESQAKLKNNMLRRFREIHDDHEKEVVKLKQQYTNNCRKHSLFKESIMKGRNGNLKSHFSGIDYGHSLQQADAVIEQVEIFQSQFSKFNSLEPSELGIKTGTGLKQIKRIHRGILGYWIVNEGNSILEGEIIGYSSGTNCDFSVNYIFVLMANNPAIIEVADNSEEIKQKIKKLPLKEKLKAVALNYYLSEKKKLDIELEKEMKNLQKKYDKLASQLYHKANEIIEGVRLCNEEELKDVDYYLEGDEATQKNQALTQDPISGYWFKALKNSDIIAQEIKERDESILKYLTKIEYQQQENSENFTLIFHFLKNEYFTNTQLKKKFILKDGENPVKSDGTIIEWGDGKNVTKKMIKKKQLNKTTGMMNITATEVEAESFFNFFNSINLEDKEMIEKLVQQTKLDKHAERMDIDYDIARMIIDEIIPYSLEYYLGVKINDAYDDIEDLDGDKSDDSEEDEFDK